jgi:Ca-activated chloride channel family protein
MRTSDMLLSRNLRPLALTMLAAAAVLSPGGASAQDKPATVIVLDGSGSMGGPLEGQTEVKFDMARYAIRQGIAKAAPDVPLGLVVVGHRRKGNCADVEIVTPPAPGTKPQMIARLDRIGTVGKGPLVQGLREAAKALAPGAKGALVLIHDDADNCRQDVCAAAAEMTRSNPGVAVHVVTISLDPAVADAMRCLARTTGGQQFVAKGAAEVEKSVVDAIALAALSPGAAPEAKTAPPGGAAEPAGDTQGPSRIRLTAALSAKSAPLARSIGWRIASEKEPGRILHQSSGAELAQPLPAGRYTVEASVGRVVKQQPLVVAEAGETRARIALEAGLLKIKAHANKNADPLVAPILTIMAVGAADERADDSQHAKTSTERTAMWVGRNPNTDLVLPAGRYLVRLSDGHAVKEAPVELSAGTEATADFVMGTGQLEVWAAASEGGEPLEGATIILSVDDPDAPEGRREVTRTASPRPQFLLSAGTYYATARLGTAEARQRIAIGTGDIIKQPLTLGVARLSLAANYDAAIAPAGSIVRYRIFRAGTDAPEIAHSTSSSPDLFLPPGSYRVLAQLGTLPLSAETQIDVAAGQTSKAVLQIASAEVTLKAGSNAAQGPDDSRWELRDSRGHVVLRSLQGETKSAHISPGRYMLRSERGESVLERTIDLKAGERKAIDTGQN